jgi:cellulose synthase/poly-beta-1,6-N-acetylglucosamine synthase-like glycosyltransferase
MILKILFWLFLIIILYTYLGYTLILLISSIIRNLIRKGNSQLNGNYEPEVTLIIPSYNEEKYVIDKVNNCLALNYAPDKLKIVWITDGTTDNTYNLLCRYPSIKVMHEHERKGKIHAMNRGMKAVKSPIVVFTDANSMLNPEALNEIVKPFADETVGCVTGEKRIASAGKQKAVSAGEGLYWKYEARIKKLESDTGSVVGAVGEIFAIRASLYEEVSEDTLLDDFTLSLLMIRKGYSIKYAPGAWGIESASLTVSDEIKRKTRIASGGMQSLTRMADLLNPLKYGLLSLKYISHKVLRWTLVPFAFPLIFILNLVIIVTPQSSAAYVVLFCLQCLFYLMAWAGWMLENVKTRLAVFFAPYYLFIMNYAVLVGFLRFFTGNYSVKWQKVKRT